MAWLIALLPAVVVYMVTAITQSRSALFWVTAFALTFAAMGFSSYLFLDILAVLVGAVLAWKTVDFTRPAPAAEQPVTAEWVTAQIERGTGETDSPSTPLEEHQVASPAPLKPPPSPQELAHLRQKIQAEHRTNDAARKRERDRRNSL